MLPIVEFDTFAVVNFPVSDADLFGDQSIKSTCYMAHVAAISAPRSCLDEKMWSWPNIDIELLLDTIR